MSKMQRDKGRAFEQWVVRQFKAAGFHAERTAPMQAGIYDSHADVAVKWKEISPGNHEFIHLECKHHADLPAYLWEPDPFANRPVPQYLTEWLDGNDAVVFKGHGKKYPAMVFQGNTVQPLADYIEGLL